MGLGLQAAAGSGTLDHPGETGHSEWRVGSLTKTKHDVGA
jgi:hypothetical protein